MTNTGDRTSQDSMTITIEPDAALSLINTPEWDEDGLDFLRELADCVENDEPLSWEVPKNDE